MEKWKIKLGNKGSLLIFGRLSFYEIIILFLLGWRIYTIEK